MNRFVARASLVVCVVLLTVASNAQRTLPISGGLGPLSDSDLHWVDSAVPRGWDYPWHVVQNCDGTFENTVDEEVRPQDTAHLPFTAHVQTWVQGAYTIRYADAQRQPGGSIIVTLADGLPAYANSLVIRLTADSFFATPQLVFPGEKSLTAPCYKDFIYGISARVESFTYPATDTLFAYLDIQFNRCDKNFYILGEPAEYSFQGFIRTAVRRLEDDGRERR